jgi:hypothetical protein
MAQPVGTYTNPLKKFKLVFLGEQSGMGTAQHPVQFSKVHLTKR